MFFVVIVCITIFGSAFSMVCGMQYMPGAAAEDGLFFEVRLFCKFLEFFFDFSSLKTHPFHEIFHLCTTYISNFFALAPALPSRLFLPHLSPRSFHTLLTRHYSNCSGSPSVTRAVAASPSAPS
jgi:hypothetical protein